MRALLTMLFLLLLSLAMAQSDSSMIQTRDTIATTLKNCVNLETRIVTLGINYERSFILGQHHRLSFAVGLDFGISSYASPINPRAKAAYLLGGRKHFMEAGVLISPLAPKNYEFALFVPQLGYYFTEKGGFQFRAGLMIWPDKVDGETVIKPFPYLSIGVCF